MQVISEQMDTSLSDSLEGLCDLPDHIKILCKKEIGPHPQVVDYNDN